MDEILLGILPKLTTELEHCSAKFMLNFVKENKAQVFSGLFNFILTAHINSAFKFMVAITSDDHETVEEIKEFYKEILEFVNNPSSDEKDIKINENDLKFN